MLSEWIDSFIAEHAARCGGGLTPDALWPSEHDRGVWVGTFDAERITEEEAHRASERLAPNPPSHPAYHLDLLCALVRDGRRFAGPRPGTAADEVVPGRVNTEGLRELRRDSWRCPQCDGAGLAVRYLPRAVIGGRVYEPAPPQDAVTVTLTCICTYGRWIRARQQDGNDGRALMPDLAEHTWLQAAAADWSGRDDRIDTPWAYPPRWRPDGCPEPERAQVDFY